MCDPGGHFHCFPHQTDGSRVAMGSEEARRVKVGIHRSGDNGIKNKDVGFHSRALHFPIRALHFPIWVSVSPSGKDLSVGVTKLMLTMLGLL